MISNDIKFESIGIAKVLADNRLKVPLNQRSYKWEEEHIKDLFADITDSLSRTEYFLGTIVLTGGSGDERPEIADGQQRLATTTVLLAAIRDYLIEQNEKERAAEIQRRFLKSLDLDTHEVVPYLELNVSDNEYFKQRILGTLDAKEDGRAKVTPESHERINKAAILAAEHVRDMVKPVSSDEGIRRLIELVKYLEKSVVVILVRVPQQLSAFRMFETLNDRGLDLSEADLLKNLLFDKAGDRIEEANHQWSFMEGTLESVGRDASLVTYIRHYWITQHGHTKEKELYEKIATAIKGKKHALDMLQALSSHSTDYAAIFSPYDEKWNGYGTQTKRHIEVIRRHLQVSQIRPLLFAIAMNFSVKEAQRAFRMCVCWSVRYIFVGGRGGALDALYSTVAQKVGTRAITSAEELYNEMLPRLPQDAEFKAAFATATVSRAYWARYFLRSLQMKANNDPHPENIPNDDENSINLEHILPRIIGGNWPAISEDHAKALYQRLGNEVLLQASVNSDMGNSGFNKKRPVLAKSTYSLTNMVGKESDWGQDQIDRRQKTLAKLAVSTWPTKPD